MKGLLMSANSNENGNQTTNRYGKWLPRSSYGYLTEKGISSLQEEADSNLSDLLSIEHSKRRSKEVLASIFE
jgi:hypothetical protein